MYGEFRGLRRRGRLRRVGTWWSPRRGIVKDMCWRTSGRRRRDGLDGQSSVVVIRSASLPPLIHRPPSHTGLLTRRAAALQSRPGVDLLPVQTSTAKTAASRHDHDGSRGQQRHHDRLTLSRHLPTRSVQSSLFFPSPAISTFSQGNIGEFWGDYRWGREKVACRITKATICPISETRKDRGSYYGVPIETHHALSNGTIPDSLRPPLHQNWAFATLTENCNLTFWATEC